MQGDGAPSSLKSVDTSSRSSNSDRKWTLSNFNLGKRLGNGRFGSVFVASETSSKYIVALKILFKSEIYESIQYQVQREIDIQFHLQ